MLAYPIKQISVQGHEWKWRDERISEWMDRKFEKGQNNKNERARTIIDLVSVNGLKCETNNRFNEVSHTTVKITQIFIQKSLFISR